MVCIGPRIWFQRRQVCHNHPHTLWTEERWQSIPCPLGGLHAKTWLHNFSCQSGPVVQRGETTRNWGIVLLLHLDLYDDILCIHHDAMPVLDKLNQYFTLKSSSVGNPSMYLGAKLKLTQISNVVWVWGMSPLK